MPYEKSRDDSLKKKVKYNSNYGYSSKKKKPSKTKLLFIDGLFILLVLFSLIILHLQILNN